MHQKKSQPQRFDTFKFAVDQNNCDTPLHNLKIHQKKKY